MDTRFENLWRANHLPFDRNAFRVIQPTGPSVTRAIGKWCVEDAVSISPEMVEVVFKFFPELRKYPVLCNVSTTPTLDDFTFASAFPLWLSGMEQYEAGQRSLYDPEVKFNKSSIPGPILSAEVGDDGKRIKTKDEALTVYPLYSLSYADRCHMIPALYSVSGKEELIKKAKWETGNIRSFAPMPLDAHLESMYLFSGIHIRMAELAHERESPIGVGWINQHGGFINEMRFRDRALWNVDSDVEKWDAKFSRLLHWIECGWHMRVAKKFNYKSLVDGIDACDSIYAIFRDMAYTYVFNPLDQSVLLFDVGQPSGTTKTSYSNSTGHMFIGCYHYVKCKHILANNTNLRFNWSQFCKDVTFKVYGDDNGTQVWNPELVPFYSFEKLDETYRAFNLSLDKSKSLFRKSVLPSTDAPGMQWLGFRCGPDYVPMFDAEKAACSMLNPTKNLAPPQALLKAVSLMINVTFSDELLFDTIRLYAQNLVKECGLEVPNFGWVSYATIPTREDCVRFWTGDESGKPLDPFLNFCHNNFKPIEEFELARGLSTPLGGVLLNNV